MEPKPTTHWKFPRHKAAFRRSRLSSPIAIAIDKGIITPETSVFDYGTGKGDCVNFLNPPFQGFQVQLRVDNTSKDWNSKSIPIMSVLTKGS